MSTSLSLIRQEMLQARSDELGRVLETPTSITTTTAVFNSLKTGGVLAAKFVNRWLVRPDAATALAADRVRRITDFASATGTLTHAGTNYADTTAGTEVFEVLEFEPKYYDEAINWAIGATKFLDRTEILAPTQGGTAYLTQLTWMDQPSQLRYIKRVDSPQLSRNRDFTKWNSYSSGALQPDDWAVSGTGATMVRGSTFTWKGSPYSITVTPGGAAAGVVTQTVGLMESGVTADSLRGETVTVVGRIRCTDASNARVWVSEDGGTTKNYSSYHTGGSTMEELSKEYAITSSATGLSFGMESASGKAACQVGELWLQHGSLTDTDRRGNPGETTVWSHRFNGQAAMPLVLPGLGYDAHYAVYSTRGYPQIDATRIAAGSADDDAVDAPKTLIVTGAIGKLYSVVGESDHSDAARWRSLGQEWMQKFEQMHRRHMLDLDANDPGWQPRRKVYGYASPAGV